MREHLYRGKSTGDLGPWIYGYYHYDKTTDTHYICDKDTLVRYDVIPNTVGQYTGQKDRIKKVIYEGDIVKAIPNTGYRFGSVGVIEFVEDYGGYAVVGEWNKNQHHSLLTCDVAIEVQIIGSIYDNPELLQNK